MAIQGPSSPGREDDAVTVEITPAEEHGELQRFETDETVSQDIHRLTEYGEERPRAEPAKRVRVAPDPCVPDSFEAQGTGRDQQAPERHQCLGLIWPVE